MRNIKLTLAYDGTGYLGWQTQANGRGIQEVVEAAIRDLTGEQPRLLVAGRTDAGVHALGQVCSFLTNASIPCRGFRDAMKDRLPEDILVRDAEDVPLNFHATYSAKRKHYRYVILNSQLENPFFRRYSYCDFHELDVPAMHAAAQELLGKHDFRCFETNWPNKATSVRTVMQASVTRQAGWPLWSIPEPADCRPVQPVDSPGELLWIDIVADGFLYNMVRCIAGTLLRVGRGYWQPQDVRRIIQEQKRTLAGETAPPQGLYLIRVDYECPKDHSESEQTENESMPMPSLSTT